MGARGGRWAGPAAAPPRAEEGGRCHRREGGDPTCPVSPQAPRAIPAPRAREGKGREGEAAGRWGFPSLSEKNWDSGVQTLPLQLRGVLLPRASERAGSSLRAWHPRGAPLPLPRPSQFSHPDLAESHPPTSRARLLSPLPPLPRRGGLAAPRTALFMALYTPYRSPLSRACLPSL